MAPKHREFVKKRTMWLFLVFTLMFLGLAGRLAWVQVLHTEDYKEWAKQIRYRDRPIPAQRGAIYDRNGEPLAMSIQASGIYAAPREMRDKAATARAVAEALGADVSDIRTKLESGKSFVWLARQIDPRAADKVEALRSDYPGLRVVADPKRVYPCDRQAAHILGFVSVKNTPERGLVTEGVEGLEALLNSELTGQEGLVRTELDAQRRDIAESRHKVRDPKDGMSVHLTLDLKIQHISEVALARMVETYKPRNACVVVMDPNTGEILALANYPSYDPNRPWDSEPSLWRNHAVSDQYEPGSTLKTMTVAAALNEGVGPHSSIAYCKGHERIPGVGRMRCSLHHPFMAGHASVDPYRIIEHSCNIGAGHLGLRLGAEKLYSYEKKFGLIDKCRSGMTGEPVSFTMPAKDWCRIRVANVGFGQGIAVTPLQMATAYCVIANGGRYVQPRMVRVKREANGAVVEPFKPRVLRRVISEDAADEVTRMLVRCVDEGTGKTAAIEGRSVAGKTGSAQIGKPKGGFEAGAFVASFIGFAPANNPRLVIAVVVTRPQGSHWGATVAAPVFKEIGEKALWYLKAPADRPVNKTPGGKDVV